MREMQTWMVGVDIRQDQQQLVVDMWKRQQQQQQRIPQWWISNGDRTGRWTCVNNNNSTESRKGAFGSRDWRSP